MSADLIDNIIAYEQGDLGDEQAITMFQGMMDDGLVWTLQGQYGRTARMLIEDGFCHSAK